MSYLTLPAGIPNFSKTVISLWFRAPRASILATVQRTFDDPNEFKILQSIQPLLVFGKPQQNKNHQYLVGNILTNPPEPHVVINTAYDWSVGPSYNVDPCFIGLVCFGNGTFSLAFNLQMNDYGTYENLIWLATSATIKHDPPWPPPYLGNTLYTIMDGSLFTQDAQPEFFYVETSARLQPDRWHHLLLSFDLSGTLSIGEPFASSTCRLWYAIDDVDYRGAQNLQPYRDAAIGEFAGDGLDPNAILTSNMYQQSTEFSNLAFGHTVPDPTGTYNPAPIVSNGEHFGFPATPLHVDTIRRVEMAEFQMWTGITLNTGDVAKRRAFIDAEGKPVKPKEAETLLGRRPVVLLHGSSNWKKGTNTGSSGKDDDGEIIESGQFQRTAKIEAYKPDPSLHGPQERGG